MRRMWLATLGSLLVAVVSVRAADSSDGVRKWQGTWRLVACTYDGAPKMNDVRWVVNGDRYTIHLRESEETWTFRLDAGNRIESNHHVTPIGYSGGRLTGIYEVSGDTLRVCYDLTGRSYPKSFDAKKGSRQILYEFRRERP